MRLGIVSYSYTWAVGVPDNMPLCHMSVFDLINKAFELGVQCVQIADNLPLHDLSSYELKELREHSISKSIGIEVGTRGLQYENVLRYIDIAALLKSPILRVVVDGPGFEPELDEVIQTINNLIPALCKSNIMLAIENHDRFHALEFVQMINETNRDVVGICLDSVNSMGAGEGIIEVVKTLAPFTINLHVKDFSVKRVWHKMGFVIEGMPAGDGMLDIENLFKQIELNGKCNSAILELWTPPEDTLELTIMKEKQWVDKSISYLKKLQ